MGNPGECHIGRFRDQAVHRAARHQVRGHDDRTGPGNRQLGKVLPVGKKRNVTGTGLRKGGYTGERPVSFTGELQTEAVRQFSQ
jgi:hypothetical protein